MLMIGDLFLGMLTGYLRSPLSFSLCLMGRSADHQPNARSAQTGEADKLMGCAADHDPTGWDALRTMHHVDPLDRYGCGFGVCVCVWAALAWRSAYILVFRNLCSGSRLYYLILALLTWWGAPRTINQTREAHKPAKPTNSWAAQRTMIQLDGAQSAPSRLNRFQLFPMLVYLHDGVVYIVHFLAFCLLCT